MRRRHVRRRKGFTLLEVLLVVVILSVVMGIAVVNIFGVQGKAYIDATKLKLATYGTALDTYRLAVGSYPSTLDDLYVQPSDIQDPSKWIQAIKEPITPDAWGNPFEYKGAGATYEMRSAGPDGQMNTADDLIKSVQ